MSPQQKPKEPWSIRIKKFINGIFTRNPKQKILSLLVAGLIWGFILGQKETMMVKEISLEYQLRSGVEMSDSVKKVKVRLAGPSSTLRKFNEQSSSLLIDITQYPVGGLFTVELPKEGLNLPLGVKVISITPSRVPVVLRKMPAKEK